jgi:hypothetical protein
MADFQEKKCIICLEDSAACNNLIKCYQCVAYTCLSCSEQMYAMSVDKCPHCSVYQPGTPWLERFGLRRQSRHRFHNDSNDSNDEDDRNSDDHDDGVTRILFPDFNDTDHHGESVIEFPLNSSVLHDNS